MLLVGVAAPAVSVPAGDGQAGDTFFDYLHIEANSGSSSGGHAAICFGDQCFHFQQSGDRTVRLYREVAARFDHVYRALGNRTIHAYRVPVRADVRARMLEAFEDLYERQQGDFDRLDTVEDDCRFLELLQADLPQDGDGNAVVRVPGSAYFLTNESSTHVAEAMDGASLVGTVRSVAIERVARRIRARYGPHSLEARAAALGDAARDLLGGSTPTTLAAAPIANGVLPEAGFAARYRERLSAWLAAQLLSLAPPLRPASVITVPHSPAVLEPRDWGTIERFQAQLEDALVDLYGSKRADWGYPMLVGLARVAAFEEAIARRQLVLLDVFREDAEVVPAAEVSRHRDLLMQVLVERNEDLDAARAAFFDGPSEMRWSRFETAANLVAELERALRDGKGLRVHSEAPVPLRSAVRGDWPRPRVAPATITRLLPTARARAQALRDELADMYAYDILQRNCVTEILNMMAATGLVLDRRRVSGAANDADGESSATRLAETLRFIPFVSAYLVNNRLGASRMDRPSYRQLVLARMKASENGLLAQLRESNVLTSTIYESNTHDPLFLFFTDDSVFWRPLQGLANLTVAAAAAGAGAVLLPLDAGTTLRRALSGVVSSVPEIFFVSVRKGSFPFAPYRWLQEGDEASHG